MKLVLATLATYAVMAQALTERKYNDRLLSYYLLKDLPDEYFTFYVETGLSFKKPKTRRRSWNKNRQAYLRVRRLALADRLKAYEEGNID